MTSDEKRRQWEAKGRWGTHKEYLFRRRLMRGWANEYEAIQMMATVVEKINKSNQEGSDT